MCSNSQHLCPDSSKERLYAALFLKKDRLKMIKPTFIKSLIIVGLLFWAFSSEASTIAYYAANGTQISKAEYEVLDAKKSEDIIDLKYILDGDSPKNLDTEHQVAAADAKASNKDEADEEYEEEDEYDNDRFKTLCELCAFGVIHIKTKRG